MTWQIRPFDDVRRELAAVDGDVEGGTERVDPGRALRTGVPEFVLGGSKSIDQVERALRALCERQGRALATRCSDEQFEALSARFSVEFEIEANRLAGTFVVSRAGQAAPRTGGRVGIVTAGTSDIPVAAEAAAVVRELGCEVFEVRDVGVAGLHRLVRPLERLAEADVDVIVVAAGMDGALPSVVAGLVPVTVIGLPTSVGYGFGGGGVGAMTTMLQTCAPGLVVVNIDNGVGAAAAAAKIANRAASGRRRSGSH